MFHNHILNKLRNILRRRQKPAARYKFHVSILPKNKDMNEADFACSAFVEVPYFWGIISGCADDIEIEFLDMKSDPIEFLTAASGPDNINSYAFKVSDERHIVTLFRGIIIGPRRALSRPDDFRCIRFTIGLNQAPLTVERGGL